MPSMPALSSQSLQRPSPAPAPAEFAHRRQPNPYAHPTPHIADVVTPFRPPRCVASGEPTSSKSRKRAPERCRLCARWGARGFRVQLRSGLSAPWCNRPLCWLRRGRIHDPRFIRCGSPQGGAELRWTPADPRGPHQCGPSVSASDAVKNVAVCFKRNDGAVSSFGEYGLSCGLHVSLCTLQLTCSAFRLLSRSCNTW